MRDITTLKQIECPACGGTIQVPEDQDTCFCTYCGRQLAVEGRMVMIVKQTMVIEDKARLRELELQEEARIRNEARLAEMQKEAEEVARKQKKRRTAWWLMLLLSPFLQFVLLFWFSAVYSASELKGAMLVPFMIPAIMLGINYPFRKLSWPRKAFLCLIFVYVTILLWIPYSYAAEFIARLFHLV
jgi:hypothetical protein